jgi:sigma-B regulation protein RsbU (phosphoserine phosphatase)
MEVNAAPMDLKLRELQDENLRLSRENARLQRAVEELAILNEISTAINSTLSMEKILDLIAQRCIRHFQAEQGAVLLLEEQTAARPFQTICRVGDVSHPRLPFRLDDQLSGWMLKNRSPLLINDLQDDRRFVTGSGDLFPVRSLLCVPLVCKGRMIGLLAVFNKKTAGGFNADDQRLLSIIASESAQVIDNARLAEKEKTLLHVQEELRLAFEIQTNLLPRQVPLVAGYDIAGKSVPAKTVGGDYYDFLVLGEQRLAFCLGDVSGKGLPAALLMANLQAAIRGQILDGMNLTACLQRTNALLFHNTSPEKFATFFFACLDASSHTVHFCNAGHNHPFLFSSSAKDKPRRLERGGLALGFMESSPYEQDQLAMEPGDRLLVFSDGISEAANENDEEFGEERLAVLVLDNPGVTAAELIDKIIHEVKSHAGKQPQMDDMTLVVVKREA